MIHHFTSWYPHKKMQKHKFEGIYTLLCSLQHYLQKPNYGNNLKQFDRQADYEDVVHTHSEILFSYWGKNGEFLPFATAWMELGRGIVLREIRIRQIQNDFNLVEMNFKDTNYQNTIKKKQTS